ncbi:hypothetical protein CEUSTIGMA_g8447.t1 [Chlamydomonas eustigma]|uniref:Uncharacterized protein n=1 Tax=Chlamydomonas eustigma TaxID=1157962 RepID=A0A250XDP8_9CHLO|nr:hypothetical protein CEUSTIGMA_g8447.t1 [Chlamydomonas eustigma]|eukprot:GAX81012.1 hypothetical protein CEUSTIGMA_g8447.t1 [Chlamydomonas eustigma]
MKLSCQVLHISHALTVALIYAASLSKCATSLQKSIPPQPTAGDPSKVGLALNSSSSGGVSSNSSLLFDLQALRSQFRSVGDDTPHLDSSIPPALSSKLSGSSSSSRHSFLRPLKGKLGSGITIAGAGSSSSTPLASSQPSSAVTPSPIYASECTSLLPDIITMLLTQIKDSLGYVTQQGLVDFGLTGQPGETSVCAPQAEGGCAFSNPSR